MTSKTATGPIVAAVRFDDKLPRVVRTAIWLAKGRGGGVDFVHVFNPATPSATAELAALRARLAHKAAAYARAGVAVSIEVRLGSYPQELMEHAESRGAAMIVIGAHSGPDGWFNANLRPTLHLLSRASVPVLVLPEGPLSGPRVEAQAAHPLRILFADDLTEDTHSVIDAAADLIANLTCPVDLLHIHVEALPAFGIPLSPEFQLDIWPSIDVHDREVRQHHNVLKAHMRDRARRLAAVVEAAGGRYHAELWHGNVAEEITRAAEALPADVTIFGRHQFLHRQPLSFGHMPIDAMLKVDSAVMIAPQRMPT